MIGSKLIKDHPNPSANVAIILPPYFFFVDVFRTVLENLPNAEFVPDFTQPLGYSTYSDEYRFALHDYLNEGGFYWRSLEVSNLQPPEFFEKYAVLIANHYSGYARHPYNKDKKKVRIFYGTAKDSWGFDLRNAYFDLLLCPGPYALENLTRYSGTAVAIGEPKHDGIVNTPPNHAQKVAALALTLSLDTNKETILYMPTYGSLSSIDATLPALISMQVTYNVIVRPHHATSAHDHRTMDTLRSSSLKILDSDVSLASALHFADVVVSDSSGSIFDALVAEKPIVLIDTIPDKDEFFVEQPFYGLEKGRLRGGATHRESIDQVVKSEGSEIAPTVRLAKKGAAIESFDLRASLLRVRERHYRLRQAIVQAKLFSYTDGNAGERAAATITKFMMEGFPHRDKTLERLVDELIQRTRNETLSSPELNQKSAMSQLERYQSIRQLPLLDRLKAVYETFF